MPNFNLSKSEVDLSAVQFIDLAIARFLNFSERAKIIATYALCGFSNLGSIGIQIGGIAAVAPSRQKDLAQLSINALIAGSIACFMTACVAGILI